MSENSSIEHVANMLQTHQKFCEGWRRTESLGSAGVDWFNEHVGMDRAKQEALKRSEQLSVLTAAYGEAVRRVPGAEPEDLLALAGASLIEFPKAPDPFVTFVEHTLDEDRPQPPSILGEALVIWEVLVDILHQAVPRDVQNSFADTVQKNAANGDPNSVMIRRLLGQWADAKARGTTIAASVPPGDVVNTTLMAKGMVEGLIRHVDRDRLSALNRILTRRSGEGHQLSLRLQQFLAAAEGQPAETSRPTSPAPRGRFWFRKTGG